MVLYLIGLGLYNIDDVTVKGMNIIKNCEEVYLESYTSILGVKKDELEKFYGRKIITAFRETCEIEMDNILENISKNNDKDYAILVVGDPFCATTHTDLFIRANKLNIKIQAIHNASIMNSIGITGLQLYSFGQTVSVPLFTEKWRPYSFIDRIKANIKMNLHTLVLLDIKVREISEENLIKGIEKYEPPYFMSIKEAVEQILEASKELKIDEINENSLGYGISRLGSDDQQIVSGKLTKFLDYDMGKPLHSFIICAPELHELEKEMFEYWKNKK